MRKRCMQGSGEECVMAFDEGEEAEVGCDCCERARSMLAIVRGKSAPINMRDDFVTQGLFCNSPGGSRSW